MKKQAKYKIERKSFADRQKAYELWKDKTPSERLIALQKLRRITFNLKNERDKQRSIRTDI